MLKLKTYLIIKNSVKNSLSKLQINLVSLSLTKNTSLLNCLFFSPNQIDKYINEAEQILFRSKNLYCILNKFRIKTYFKNLVGKKSI